MRPVLGFVAATLLLASPRIAAAQPSSEALLDSVLAALRPDDQAGTVLGLFQSQFPDGVGAPGAVRDSVEAAFRADLRPDLLRDALPYLQSPGHARLLARTIDAQPTLAQLVAVAYGYPPDLGGPKKGTLADSVLAVRYAEARGADRATLGLMERVIRSVIAAEPAAAADLVRNGGTVEDGIAAALADMETSNKPIPAARARFALTGLPPRDVEAEIAFLLSPAGRYVTERLDAGLMTAVAPQLTDRILEQFLQSRGESDDVPPPPPPPRFKP